MCNASFLIYRKHVAENTHYSGLMNCVSALKFTPAVVAQIVNQSEVGDILPGHELELIANIS